MSRNESIFYNCFAIVLQLFCNSGLLSKTVHTSSYKKIYQFCTVSRTDINSKSRICGRTIMTKQTMVWQDKMKNCCGTAI